MTEERSREKAVTDWLCSKVYFPYKFVASHLNGVILAFNVAKRTGWNYRFKQFRERRKNRARWNADDNPSATTGDSTIREDWVYYVWNCQQLRMWAMLIREIIHRSLIRWKMKRVLCCNAWSVILSCLTTIV